MSDQVSPHPPRSRKRTILVIAMLALALPITFLVGVPAIEFLRDAHLGFQLLAGLALVLGVIGLVHLAEPKTKDASTNPPAQPVTATRPRPRHRGGVP